MSPDSAPDGGLPLEGRVTIRLLKLDTNLKYGQSKLKPPKLQRSTFLALIPTVGHRARGAAYPLAWVVAFMISCLRMSLTRTDHVKQDLR